MEIDVGELGYDESDGVFLYKGEPFTGVAVEKHRGRRIAETPYEFGQRHGRAREWARRTLIRDCEYYYGSVHGECREWWEDGTPKLVQLCELGVVLYERSYEPDGTLASEYLADPESFKDEVATARLWYPDAPPMPGSLEDVKKR
jgi:hypothetical protein